MIISQRTVCTILTNKLAISSRGQRLWKKFLDNNIKSFPFSSLFQKTIKIRLINLEIVFSFF